jgi:hypothetical protein
MKSRVFSEAAEKMKGVNGRYCSVREDLSWTLWRRELS